MAHVQTFRCPYEEKGHQDDTIVTVMLSTERSERLTQITTAFKRFYERTDLIGIRFCLPPSLWQDVRSLPALADYLLPIQCEIVAGECEVRLAPFLPYQFGKVTKEESDAALDKRRHALWIAYALAEAFESTEERFPADADDLATWIQRRVEDNRKAGLYSPHIGIVGPIESTLATAPKFHLLTLTIHGVTFPHERLSPENATKNQNTFSVVKAPFYPKKFGRYSEMVEVVVTREAHFAALPPDVRKKIRIRSNETLRRSGVRVKDLAEDKQELGVWIPEYRGQLPQKR